jgi:hypothetical protein
LSGLIFLLFRKNFLSLAIWSLWFFFVCFMHALSSLYLIVSVINYILIVIFLFKTDMERYILKERTLVFFKKRVMKYTVTMLCILNFLKRSIFVLHHVIINYMCYLQLVNLCFFSIFALNEMIFLDFIEFHFQLINS